MSVEWNDNTLNDILSDVGRMEREREQTSTVNPLSAEQSENNWTMDEVDRLLGVDKGVLEGISDYDYQAQEAPVLIQQDDKGQAEFTVPDLPPVRPPVRKAPLHKRRRRSSLPGQESEDTQQAVIEIPVREDAAPRIPELPKEDAQPPVREDAARRIPELPKEDAQPPVREDATRRIPELPKEDAQPPVREDATRRIPELPKEDAQPPVREDATRRIPDLSAPDKDVRDGKTKVLGKLPLHGRKQKPQPRPDSEMVDGQMMLQGFQTEEPAEQLDEQQAAKELDVRRQAQVKDFKLLDFAKKYDPDLPPKDDIFDEPEPGESPDSDEGATNRREYRHLGERMRVGKLLQEDRRNAFLSVCAMTILEVVLIVLAIVTGAKSTNREILYAVSLVLLAFSAALSISDILDGVKSLLKWKPNCDTAAAFTTLFAFAQGAAAFVVPDSESIPSAFCAAAAGMLLMNKIAKLAQSLAILSNFKFAAFSAAERLYEIRGFADKSEAFEVGKSLQVGEPKLRYSHPTRFPSGFIRHSAFRTSIDRLCKILLPTAFGLSLVSAVFAGFRTQSVLSALTAFSCVLCVAMPAGAAVTAAVPIAMLMRSLNRRGGMIASPEAAAANAGIHGVAVDAVDLYDRKATVIDCYKDYHAIRFDDMFLYAAALVIGAHSPLEGAFMEMVGNVDILPPVKNLICEEKLGISGYIHDQSVLLGSRNLLTNHSIDPPPKSVEMRYIQEGKRVLYLAVGNKIATMFVIDYRENYALSSPLQTLQNNEISLVVYAPDCNITEDFLAEGFELSKGSAKLMSPAAGKILRERSAETTDAAPALLLHDGKTESLLRTVADAAVIQNIQRVAAFIAIIGTFIGWLVSFILLLTRGIPTMNWVFATLYPTLWTLLSVVMGILQARKAAK